MSGVEESRDTNYRTQVDPFYADKRHRVIPDFPLRRLVLPLDAARVEFLQKLSGDALFVDRLSTGLITVKLNGTSEDPIPLAALDGVEGFPIQDVLISNTAQPGLVINLWYGYQGRIRANSQTLTSIGTITNPVGVQGPRTYNNAPLLTDLPVLMREVGAPYGASSANASPSAALTPISLVPPGTNTNGLIVWAGGVYGRNSAGPAQQMTLLAKSSPPVSITDGDILSDPTALTELAAASSFMARISRPTFVAAGKGVYKMNLLAEANQYSSLLYTLL